MKPRAAKASLALGVAVGVVYGLVAYFTFAARHAMPTVGFLFVLPTALGALPMLFADEDQIRNYAYVLLVPWLTVFTFFVALGALQMEGLICVAVLAAPFAILAMAGSLIVAIIRGRKIRRDKLAKKADVAATVATFMMAPLFLLAFEPHAWVRTDHVRVRSEVIVDAPAEVVFSQLAIVPTISLHEYELGVFHRLGIPRPIRATVDRVGLGGHRVGHFERGLRFNEIITHYDPPRRLDFDITIDARTLQPNTTEHHAVEGNYGRFLDAKYVLTPRRDGRTALVLSSRYELHTSVNGYGHLWARAIIRDFQDRVLDVLAARAEHIAHRRPGRVAESNAPR